MQKWLVAGIAMMLGVTAQVNAQSYNELVQKYITDYKEMAIAEQRRSGIPASITLAQGIHETSAGKSELATEANNHFGIKCKKNWTGMTYSYTDDAPDECFRKYNSALESYKDHSDYLSTSQRYAELFKLSPTDYAAWAIGLKRAGYATNPKYAQMLIGLIEDYKLQEFTYVALDNTSSYTGEVAAGEIVPEHDANTTAAPVVVEGAAEVGEVVEITPEVAVIPVVHKIVVTDLPASAPGEDTQITYPPYGTVVKVNGLKAVYARKGDMPLEHAINNNIRYEKLLEMNDISDRPLQADMYLYLERKNTRGLRPTHKVKEGETIEQVAQFEGMQLKNLRALNMLKPGEQPVAGSVLRLQEQALSKPIIVAATAATPATVIADVPVEQPVVNAAVEQPAVEQAYIEKPKEETPKEETVAAEQPAVTEEAPPAEPSFTASVDVGITSGQPQPGIAATTVAVVAATDAPVVADAPVADATSAPADAPATTPVAETPATAPAPVQEPAVNIANEQPVEAQMKEEKKQAPAQPVKEEEPKDELDALKARFDKVVYADGDNPEPVAAATPAAEPEVKKEEPAPKPVPAKQEAGGQMFHVVKKGDTAFSIAKKYSISMDELRQMNDLDFEKIKVGQRLRIKP